MTTKNSISSRSLPRSLRRYTAEIKEYLPRKGEVLLARPPRSREVREAAKAAYSRHFRVCWEYAEDIHFLRKEDMLFWEPTPRIIWKWANGLLDK